MLHDFCTDRKNQFLTTPVQGTDFLTLSADSLSEH